MSYNYHGEDKGKKAKAKDVTDSKEKNLRLKKRVRNHRLRDACVTCANILIKF